MRTCGLLIALFLTACGAALAAPRDAAQTLSWRVLRALPHDPQHFTQGLVLHHGRIIESAGLYGRSALYEKELTTGRILRSARVPREWFAEGVTVWRDQIVLLTWLEQIAQVLTLDLIPVAQLSYRGEGWGITHNDAHLITSDGSATLRLRQPEDFSVVRELTVSDGARPINALNELEYARGAIFANVWRSERIAMIDPDSGRVRAWIDLHALLERFDKPSGWDAREHVLNGIAHDPQSDRFYITGKCWPVMFEIEIDHPDAEPRRTGPASAR